MRRGTAAAFALALCAFALARPGAETSEHQRLSVRRPGAVTASLDLDLELAAPTAGLLEGGLALGLGLDLGGWLEVGLSLPILVGIDLSRTPRRASRFSLAPGCGDLRLGLGFSAGPWRFSGKADLGYRPAFEGGPASIACGLGMGALRFLDPLALGVDLSAGASFACREAPTRSQASAPLSLSLDLLALEALNSEASIAIQVGQSLAPAGRGCRGPEGWAYSVSLGFRFIIVRGSWGLRLGVAGLQSPSFQSGASFVWRPSEVSPPLP